MSESDHMQVRLQLPSAVLFEGKAIQVNATAANGSFGILPNHVDFLTALVPSVLLIKTLDNSELVFGIDEGLLVKKGAGVGIVVRRGSQSDDLEMLRETVGSQFAEMEDDERAARAALSKLEANMVRRFASLRQARP